MMLLLAATSLVMMAQSRGCQRRLGGWCPSLEAVANRSSFVLWTRYVAWQKYSGMDRTSQCFASIAKV